MKQVRKRGVGTARSGAAWALFGLGLLLTSPPARAVDGVIEINQAAALAGGITSCDTPGFPVQLCTSGSYRLTSNLSFASGAGILLSAPDITLDLNGMTVQGPATCTTGSSGWVTSCTGDTAFFENGGIRAIAAPRAKVRNGTVRGAGASCVDLELGDGAIVEDLVLTDCGVFGAILGSRSTASNIDAIGNGASGISAGDNLRASDLLLTNNRGAGILAGLGSELNDVVAGANQTAGIFLGSRSVLRSAVGIQNGSHGIQAGIGSLVESFSATLNGGSGVRLLDGSLARAGVSRDNGTVTTTSCGLQGQGGAAYREVVITAAVGGNPSKACGLIDLGNNTCQGTTCPP